MSSPLAGNYYERITYSGVNKPKPLLSFVRDVSGGAEWRFFLGNKSMHRITKSHLESFSKSYGYNNLDESTQFEYFVNYVVLAPRISNSYELEDVTTDKGDDGVDGIALIIDEELVISDEDTVTIFQSGKKNRDVDIVFTQSKTSESFDLGDFLKFKESILRFLTADKYESNDSVQNNSRSAFDVVMKNVPKIRNGKPNIIARYVTTGIYRKPDALETAKNDFCNQLGELGFFSSVDIEFLGRDEVTALWINTYESVSAEIPMFSSAALPPIHGIDEAYLTVVKAKDLVNNLLMKSNQLLPI